MEFGYKEEGKGEEGLVEIRKEEEEKEVIVEATKERKSLIVNRVLETGA